MISLSTSSPDSRIAVGLFADWGSAERAYQSVLDRGYNKNDVSLIVSGVAYMDYFLAQYAVEPESGNGAMRASESQTADTLAAALAEDGTALFLRTDGLVISGPIASMMASEGPRGLPGGLVGALAGSEIGGEKIKQYEAGINTGGILMGIRSRSQEHRNRFEAEWTNTTDKFHHDGVRRMLYGLDQPPGERPIKPRKVIKQAYKDLKQGMVDTDRYGEHGVEEGVNQPDDESGKDSHAD